MLTNRLSIQFKLQICHLVSSQILNMQMTRLKQFLRCDLIGRLNLQGAISKNSWLSQCCHFRYLQSRCVTFTVRCQRMEQKLPLAVTGLPGGGGGLRVARRTLGGTFPISHFCRMRMIIKADEKFKDQPCAPQPLALPYQHNVMEEIQAVDLVYKDRLTEA